MTRSTLPLSVSRSVGDLVFVSGQIALRDGAIVNDDVAVQTNYVLDLIDSALATEGCTLSDVVKTSVWLTDVRYFQRFNEAYAARFDAPFPARSTVICGLATAGAHVEIDAIAKRRER